MIQVIWLPQKENDNEEWSRESIGFRSIPHLPGRLSAFVRAQPSANWTSGGHNARLVRIYQSSVFYFPDYLKRGGSNKRLLLPNLFYGGLIVCLGEKK